MLFLIGLTAGIACYLGTRAYLDAHRERLESVSVTRGSLPWWQHGPLLKYVSRLFMLPSRRRELREAEWEWPIFVESMAVAVGAGLDLRTAFKYSVSGTHGLLRKELEKVSLRLASGMPLGKALLSLERDGLKFAERLRSALVRAELLGTPVAALFDSLVQEHQTRQRQMMEKRLNALPVRLSVICALLLLPPVFIVSVVPHVIAFIGTKW